jgi:hypothetical protein
LFVSRAKGDERKFIIRDPLAAVVKDNSIPQDHPHNKYVPDMGSSGSEFALRLTERRQRREGKRRTSSSKKGEADRGERGRNEVRA